MEKEWKKLEKQELKFLESRMGKQNSRLNQFLEQKVPQGLQESLDKAFAKAFHLIFEKGTAVIEKTFSKKNTGSGNMNLLLSGVSGMGLGILGIGMPDIVIFTGLMLKSVYEIALSYGFGYETRREKLFILLIIRGAVSHGEELKRINDEINNFIDTGRYCGCPLLQDSIDETAGCLSRELLYMKFLQGIPVAGVLGGAYDVVYMKQIVTYAKLKYRRRFYRKSV